MKVRIANNKSLIRPMVTVGFYILNIQMNIKINESIKLCQNLIYIRKNRATMKMTRNKQKATLYTLQRSNETQKRIR